MSSTEAVPRKPSRQATSSPDAAAKQANATESAPTASTMSVTSPPVADQAQDTSLLSGTMDGQGSMKADEGEIGDDVELEGDSTMTLLVPVLSVNTVVGAAEDGSKPAEGTARVLVKEPSVRVIPVPGNWTCLKFKKPKLVTPTSAGSSSDVTKKRYCPPPVTSSSLVSICLKETPTHPLLCAFGGIYDKSPTNAVWIYDITDRRWSSVQEGVPLGEGDGDGEGGGDQSPLTLKRKKLRAQPGFSPVFPPPRCGHNAVVFNPEKEFFIFGGANISNAMYYNDLWSFDVELYRWNLHLYKGVPPCPRWQASAINIEDRMFVYAGEGQNYNILDDINIYSHSAEEWLRLRTIFPKPPARMMHASASISDKIYTVGGLGNQSNLHDMWCLDARNGMWREIRWRGRHCPFLTADGTLSSLTGHVCLSYDNKLLVHGGKLSQTGSFGAVTTWLFDFSSSTWQPVVLPNILDLEPSSRWKHAGCTITNTHVTPTIEEVHQDLMTGTIDPMTSESSDILQWIQTRKSQLMTQQSSKGLLGSVSCKPIVTSTQSAVLFGGLSTKPMNDLWQLRVLNP